MTQSTLDDMCLQALFSAGDSQLLPGGRTFGGVAQEVLGAEGLAAPVACREVFRFDAARVLRPDFPAARVRQQFHRMLLSMLPSCCVPPFGVTQ